MYYINTENYQNNKNITEPFKNNTMKKQRIYLLDTYNPTNINRILENIEINGKYLNVFQMPHTDKFKSLGQLCLYTDYEIHNLPEILLNKKALTLSCKDGVAPIRMSRLWDTTELSNYNQQHFSIWQPIPPNNYTILSHIITRGLDQPQLDTIYCVPNDTVSNSSFNDLLYYPYENNEYLSLKYTGNHQFFKCLTNSINSGDAKQLKENIITNGGNIGVSNSVRVTLSS